MAQFMGNIKLNGHFNVSLSKILIVTFGIIHINEHVKCHVFIASRNYKILYI